MTYGKEPVVEMQGITKRFLDVVANKNIDFSLFPGEICALLGENGAGKTTLMNILFGYYSCDEGKIFIKGEEVSLSSPRDAIKRGVGMIHQHFTLVPSQTVLENVIIGAEPGRWLLIDKKSAREKLIRLQKKFGLLIDPDAEVWTLSVGERQKVEILKALYRNVDILIMDEPTAVLALAEIVELFKTLKALASENRSIIFISHKLHEVMEISDRIVVLRNGEVVAERKTGETNVKELANLMVGRELLERIEKKEITPGERVLSVDDLTVLSDRGLEAVKKVSFSLHKYEILGMAGVSGNGQKELAEVLFGIREKSGGKIFIKGKELKDGNPHESIKRGIARIPEDRIDTGLLMDLSVEENLILEVHSTPAFQQRGLFNFQNIHNFSETKIREYNIKTDNRDAPTKTLSGGNLQKVILARELAGEPIVLIACQPTRGLDVGAMEYIHARLLEQRDRGCGILLISEDLDEIFLLSDRIIVIYEGRIIGEADIHQATREQIGLWMSGVEEK
ncbi:MAG: heme ABC transporter ATP-binding protein [Spirochaetes bacterium]|nr:MAG: heme ABC transporter ATP-binding protein [Spirochaetota bacterium]